MEFRFPHMLHLFNVFPENKDSNNCAKVLEEECIKMFGIVGFRVPADPQGSNSRVHAEITPPAYPCLVASQGSRTTQ